MAADTSPEGPDKLSIAIDTDKDGDRKLDAKDYSFSFKREGADEFYEVTNEDWYPQNHLGLHDSQESFFDGWLVIWRIPVTLKENVPIGLMVTQLDQHDTISFPDAANDLDPGTWATMIPTKLTMTFHPGTLSRGETTTIMVQTFHSSPMDSITIQYQKANTSNEWMNLFSGSPRGDLIEISWLPPAADEYRLRAIWNRSGDQTPIASTIKKLTILKAQPKLNLIINPDPVFFDEDANLLKD